jgi:hypothetical protein
MQKNSRAKGKMKTIVAGSRGVEDYAVVELAIQKSGFDITEVISGCARGVDKLGEQWADERKIPVKIFPAEWDLYGRRAGAIRNCNMAKYAEGLVAVWDGESRGTEHMIKEATRRGLKVYVHKVT